MKTRIGFEQLCAVTAALALASVQITPAQQARPAGNDTPALAVAANAPGAAAKPATAQETEENAPGAGKQNGGGIRIHGHWKFVVHDPDGKLVSERDFENSLLTPTLGDAILTELLFGTAVVADWAIVLCSAQPVGTGYITNPGGIFCNETGNLQPGQSAVTSVIVVLVTQTQGGIGSGVCIQANPSNFPCATGLETNANLPGEVNSTLVLSGNYTATQAVGIQAVQTAMAYCLKAPGARYAALSPEACDDLSFINNNDVSNGNDLLTSLFTGTNLAATQPLTAGQILTVTVTFSFS